MSSLPTFTEESTGFEVSAALKDQLAGKNVLLTGTSIGGLGFETARAMAPYVRTLYITGHNAERSKLAQDALVKEFPTANIRPLLLDLGSLVSVRQVAAELNADPEPLHVIIHNAASIGVYYHTPEGFDIQAAAALFGPFLLTKLLTPKLLASSTIPRVVFVSSRRHTFINSLDWDQVRAGDVAEVANTGPGILQRYSEVKTMVIALAAELARRAEGKMRVYSLHPGIIPTNGYLDKDFLRPTYIATGLLTEDGQPNFASALKWKTLSQGAATPIAAAFDPRLDGDSGSYIVDCVVKNEAATTFALSPDTGRRLWDLTEDALGEKFEL
ncbi:Short-chain dehydrogenase/reductase family protein [Mycena kentingensis (nom. inval.)]|nr:Short-chain dehydrogenase/reductase family protein [Mycena kentingensis (nom. inval.)]